MSFDVLHSELKYQGRAFNVRKDQIQLPNGKISHLDIVEHMGAVTIVPVDDQKRIWFVSQYRHPAQRMLLELPAGTLEEGEPPEDCARREIREEIGMAAGSIQLIGSFYLAPGYSTEYMHVYLGSQLKPAPLTGDDDEFLSVEAIHVKRVFEMIDNGEIQDAKSIAALYLARAHMKSIRE